MLIIGLLIGAIPQTAVEQVFSLNLEEIEILKPKMLAVNGKNVFIMDAYTLQITRINDGMVTAVFGKKGEGPGEIRQPVSMGVTNSLVGVNCPGGRVLWYDISGHFMKEEILVQHSTLSGGKVIDLLTENKLIGLRYDYEIENKTLWLKYFFCDNKNIFSLAKMKMNAKATQKQKIRLEDYSQPLIVRGGKIIFVAPDHNLLQVKAFSTEMNRFYANTGLLPGRRIRMTKRIRKEIMNEIRAASERYPGSSKNHFDIPDYLPAIQQIAADEEDNLFLTTYREDEMGYETLVFNQELQPIGMSYLPRYKFAAFHNGLTILVIEKKESYFLETWKLNITRNNSAFQ